MATHNRPCPAVERQTLSLPRTRGRSYGGNGGTARQLFLLCRLFLPGGGRQGITGGSTIERRCSRPRVIPPVGISIHERWLATGASSHGRRLRVRRHGEGEALAAHTLTEALLPTTRPASWSTNLQRYNTFRQSGFARPSESRSRVPRNHRRSPPLPVPPRPKSSLMSGDLHPEPSSMNGDSHPASSSMKVPRPGGVFRRTGQSFERPGTLNPSASRSPP